MTKLIIEIEKDGEDACLHASVKTDHTSKPDELDLAYGFSEVIARLCDEKIFEGKAVAK